MAHDVFISYAAEDKLTADALCARLEQHGLRCWIAPRDILPGRDWRASIVEAIGGARALVLMLSAKANSSSEIPKEILQATQKSLPIITFRIEDVTPSGPLSYELNSIHWLDAVTRPLERHIDTLAATLQRLLNVEATATPPPMKPTPTRHGNLAVMVAMAGTVVISVGLTWLWFLGQSKQPSSIPQQAVEQDRSVSSSSPRSSTGAAPSPPAEPRQTSLPAEDVGKSGRRPGTSPGQAPKPVTVPPEPRPTSLPREESSAAPTSVIAPDAKVVGCWRLPGAPGIIQVRPDGTFVSGGVVNGTWTAINPAGPSYAFQFPEESVYGEISQDGARLVNPAAPNDPLTRVSGGSGIVGVWRWANGLTVAVEPDGTAKIASLVGRWKLADQGRRTYMFVWPGPRPTITVSADGGSIKYVDVGKGVALDLQRLSC